MRVYVGGKGGLKRSVKHDDVIVVPEFFCDEDDMALYYTLVEEMRAAQDAAPPGKRNGPEWQSWHEGAHLISKDPSGSATYRDIQQRMGDYFKLRPNSRGTRFNWYNNPSDWKPFHHDSAAFNPQRARNQNVTVGVSFGDTRELAFVDAHDPTKRFYFPQTNGSLFYFGRDVNLRFKHGVNYQKEADRSSAPPTRFSRFARDCPTDARKSLTSWTRSVSSSETTWVTASSAASKMRPRWAR